MSALFFGQVLLFDIFGAQIYVTASIFPQKWCNPSNIFRKWMDLPFCILPPGVRGPPVENSASAAFAAAAPEDGPLLAAQHRGPNAADVHVRPAGPLDGLHLVHHRQDGDGGQRLQLGHRWVKERDVKTAPSSLTLLRLQNWRWECSNMSDPSSSPGVLLNNVPEPGGEA